MYPSTDPGDTGFSGTRLAVSSATVMNSWITKLCRCPCVTVEGVQSCSIMAREGIRSNVL
jgi:hypothetical protein